MAQLVEHHLAKVGVAGSNPVVRSRMLEGRSSKAGLFTSDSCWNGDVAKLTSRTKVRPGCEIVVPQKTISKMTTAETVTLGSGIASIATMVATLANILSK